MNWLTCHVSKFPYFMAFSFALLYFIKKTNYSSKYKDIHRDIHIL